MISNKKQSEFKKTGTNTQGTQKETCPTVYQMVLWYSLHGRGKPLLPRFVLQSVP